MKNYGGIILLSVACLLAVLLSLGCSLPSGTRKITAWGVGFLPIAGIPMPFAGYWYSEHGEDTDKYKPVTPPNPFGATKP